MARSLAVAMIVVGVAAIGAGAWRHGRGCLALRAPGATTALSLISLLRAVILGGALAAAGAAWLAAAPQVALLAALIACEEMLEISTVIGALRREVRLRG